MYFGHLIIHLENFEINPKGKVYEDVDWTYKAQNRYIDIY
jgi:hypothetical protein